MAAVAGLSWQVSSQPSHLSVAGTAGRIVATNGSPFHRNAFTGGVEVGAFWQQCDSNEFWVRYWQQPLFGVRGSYAHVWNGVAGDRIGVEGALQHLLVGELNLVYGVGLSFYTKPYSLTGDVGNIWIGSVMNCLIDIGLVYDIPLADSKSAFLSAKVVHSSNGYLYKPNRGLNYLQLEAGLRVGPVQKRAWRQRPGKDTLFVPSGHPFFMAAPGAVMSRYDPLDRITYYPAYTVQAGYVKHAHPCFSYGAALDVSYNFSHRAKASSGEWPLYPAASLFVDSRYGPLVLRIGLAHYLAYYPLNWEQYYERVGLYYRLGRSRRQMVGVGMKVHYDHIDYVEWSYLLEL